MGGWGKSWRPWRPYPSLLAAASRFVITAPSNVTAGRAFSLTITVQDAYGNVVTGYTGTIHFESTDGTATLPANYTFKAADNGVHTFTGLVLRKKSPSDPAADLRHAARPRPRL